MTAFISISRHNLMSLAALPPRVLVAIQQQRLRRRKGEGLSTHGHDSLAASAAPFVGLERDLLR
jgi:hypothetical protein